MKTTPSYFNRLAITACLLVAGFVAAASLRAAPKNNADAISKALHQPWGKFFPIERKGGKFHLGDPVSDFNTCAVHGFTNGYECVRFGVLRVSEQWTSYKRALSDFSTSSQTGEESGETPPPTPTKPL